MAFNAIIPNDPVEIKTAYRPTISMKKELTILLLGSGGREHALAWKIAQSAKCGKLYIAPGNAGTSNVGENVPIGVNDFEALKAFAADHAVDMVVVGPEDPLVRGIYDDFRSDARTCHIPVIGPSKAGAVLEGSKDFAKAFMQRHNIPTARYETFDGEHLAEGIAFLETLQPPYVLKADGLCAGKGVLILPTLDEAKRELREMLSGMFGNASSRVVIEESRRIEQGGQGSRPALDALPCLQDVALPHHNACGTRPRGPCHSPQDGHIFHGHLRASHPG